MGSAFHQLCPRYSGTLTPTAPTAMGHLYLLYSTCSDTVDRGKIWIVDLHDCKKSTLLEMYQIILLFIGKDIFTFLLNGSQLLKEINCSLKNTENTPFWNDFLFKKANRKSQKLFPFAKLVKKKRGVP